MSGYNLSVAFDDSEFARLRSELEKRAELDFSRVDRKTALDIYSRGQMSGGTPVGNYTGGGQLRISMAYEDDEVGYTSEYAPHVEFGHRQEVGRYVAAIGKRLVVPWVYGQFYFMQNVKTQAPIYNQYLLDYVRSANNV